MIGHLAKAHESLAKGDTRKGLKAIKLAQKADPGSHTPHLVAASWYFSWRQFKDAEKSCRKAVELEPA